MRGAVGLLITGVMYLLFAAVLVWIAVAFPELTHWWLWLAVTVLVILGVPTLVTSAMSAYAHHRRPLPQPARR